MTLDVEPNFPVLPEAACRDTDQPDAWFSFDDRVIEQARNVCRRCPALRDCLAWALANTEEGLWAGTTAEQRKTLRDRHNTTQELR